VATIQEDFDRIDVMLRQLQVKWDLFFNGAERKPPSELQTQVETLIKRLNNSEIRNNGDRFRFQGLSARYTTFNELWQKRLRAREEGRAFGRHGIKAEDSAPMRPAALAEALTHVPHPETPREFRVVDAASDASAVRALYDHYVEERKRAGEAAPAPFDSFQALIGKQAQKIRAEKGAAAVDFRLETKDGKVSLKAKVVK
jgi:hypothetical protein